MSNTWEELRSILPNVNYWRIVDDEHLMANYAHKEPELVSNAFLREAHPLLPQVTRELINRGYHKKIYVDGASVRKAGGLAMLFTVHLLCTNPLHLVDRKGTRRTLLYVGDVSIGKDTVQFHCADVTTDECTIDGQRVLLVKDGGWDYLYFNIADVDAKYPGWQERMVLAEELGQKMTDVTHFIFSKAQPDNTILPLPSIDFV